MITVVAPGPLTMVMDLGRTGYQRDGVVVGGATDRFAARVANAIVGNEETAAVLEMTQVGPELRFVHDALMAWTGAEYDARVDGERMPADRAVRIAAGERITFGRARRGVRAWMAVAGGIDVPVVLGSRSTYLAAGIGGYEGRALRAGDELALGEPARLAARLLQLPRRASPWFVGGATLHPVAPAGVVRALRGPEWAWFSSAAQRAFFSAEWAVTNEADHVGVRLAGPALTLADRRELVSEAVPEGTVQVPAGGQPIVLLANRQTVGGYPRIANVASVDAGRLAQLAPGTSVRFEEITLAAAHAAYLAREHGLSQLRAGLARLAD